MDEPAFKFKNEYGCFSKAYQNVFGINPDNEKDFSKIYEEAYETSEVL